MSCRRRDRNRLIGCHVGPGAICGCPIETTDGIYERLVTQERYTFGPSDTYGYLTCNGAKIQERDGREHCINPYRLKFVCVDCRRCFKQAIIEGNEYDTDRWGQLRRVAPTRERGKDVWETYSTMMPKAHRYYDESGAAKAFETVASVLTGLKEKEYQYWTEGPDVLTNEELEELMKVAPEFIWKDMRRNGKCPQCGKEGRAVGGTFRACAQGDDQGWARIKEMLDNGEDFSYCMTEKEQKEVIEEGNRLEDRRCDNGWETEKKRRIVELRKVSETGQRTKLEQEKLDRIRSQKEMVGQ